MSRSKNGSVVLRLVNLLEEKNQQIENGYKSEIIELRSKHKEEVDSLIKSWRVRTSRANQLAFDLASEVKDAQFLSEELKLKANQIVKEFGESKND